MRNGLIGLVGTMVLASTMATAACSDYNSGAGTGGTASAAGGSPSSGGDAPSTGGEQSTGGAATGGSSAATGGAATGGTATAGSSTNCTNVTPCGGDVVGTWTATSSCLKVTGEVNMSGFGLGCTSASIAGFFQVAGTWTLNSDGTYTDNTTTSGDAQIELPAECLFVSGTTTTCERVSGSLRSTLGYATLTCADADSGGCTCSGAVQQAGGVGFVSTSVSASGTYTTADNVVTTAAGPQYSYCVAENKMTVTPQSTGKTGSVTGSVVLHKQ